MTRTALSLLVVFLLAGALFSVVFNTPETRAIVALKDVAAGGKLSEKDVEERSVDLDKVGPYALKNKWNAIGKKLKYRIRKGQILTHWTFEGYMEKKVLFATKDIEKNEIVTRKHLGEKWTAESDPRTVIKAADIGDILGKRAANDIPAGRVLLRYQFN